jgi:hypothetical protein
MMVVVVVVVAMLCYCSENQWVGYGGQVNVL